MRPIEFFLIEFCRICENFKICKILFLVNFYRSCWFYRIQWGKRKIVNRSIFKHFPFQTKRFTTEIYHQLFTCSCLIKLTHLSYNHGLRATLKETTCHKDDYMSSCLTHETSSLLIIPLGMTKQNGNISFLPVVSPFVDISKKQNFFCRKAWTNNTILMIGI